MPSGRHGHEPHLVAGQAAVLGRRGRPRRRAAGRSRWSPGPHRSRPGAAGRRRGSGRWAGRRRPAASSAGTTVSGAGRSLMSSPGKAAWCMSVAMSPGSTAQTRRSGCSTASTAVSWSSAALAGAVPAPARVGLDGGVGADVRAPGRRRASSAGQHGLEERERGDDVDGEHGGEPVGIEVGQRGGAGSGRGRWRCSTSRSSRSPTAAAERGPVGRVGDVAGDGGDQLGPGEGARRWRPAGRASRASVTTPPAVGGEGGEAGRGRGRASRR